MLQSSYQLIQSQGYNHLLYCTTYFTAITKGGSLIKTFKMIYAKVSVKIGRQGMVTTVEMGCKRSFTLSTGKGMGEA